MRKRLIIHVGTHKTGTTSIQFFLAQHRAALKAAGIFVPRAGTGIADAPTGHHNIAYELCGDPNFDRSLGRTADLIAELRNAHEPTAVISSENLQFLHRFPDRLRKLDQDLDAAGYDRIYLVFFREAGAYFKSMFTQLKITNRLPDGSFAALARQMKTTGTMTDRIGRHFEFNRARFAQAWQDVVGPHLQCLDYDQAVAGAGVLPAFLAAIGAPAPIVALGGDFPWANVTPVGRNDPCPCRSGKRYKDCHGVRA